MGGGNPEVHDRPKNTKGSERPGDTKTQGVGKRISTRKEEKKKKGHQPGERKNKML